MIYLLIIVSFLFVFYCGIDADDSDVYILYV